MIEVKVGLRKALYASLTDREGDNNIPYSEKFNQGAVFRHVDRSKAAEYPDKWLRGARAPDRWEHVIPDGPQKAEQLKAVDAILKDRIAAGDDEDEDDEEAEAAPVAPAGDDVAAKSEDERTCEA